jgi:hypothetical protein
MLVASVDRKRRGGQSRPAPTGRLPIPNATAPRQPEPAPFKLPTRTATYPDLRRCRLPARRERQSSGGPPTAGSWQAAAITSSCTTSTSTSEGTLRDQPDQGRARAVTHLRVLASSCAAFVPAASRPCPRFQPRRSMVRRGSTVRVRQRASPSSCRSGPFVYQ